LPCTVSDFSFTPGIKFSTSRGRSGPSNPWQRQRTRQSIVYESRTHPRSAAELRIALSSGLVTASTPMMDQAGKGRATYRFFKGRKSSISSQDRHGSWPPRLNRPWLGPQTVKFRRCVGALIPSARPPNLEQLRLHMCLSWLAEARCSKAREIPPLGLTGVMLSNRRHRPNVLEPNQNHEGPS
jgi:hypothetical protein